MEKKTKTVMEKQESFGVHPRGFLFVRAERRIQ